MAYYKVESIGAKSLWEGDANKGDHPAKLTGDDREVLVFHDSSSDFPAPKVGDELYGDITKDKRGNFRFKRAKKPQGSGGKAGGYGPEEVARITRSAAVKVAAPLATGLMAHGVLVPKDQQEHWQNIQAWARRIETFIQSAAPPPSQPSLDQSSSDAPADTTGLGGAATPNPDDSIPFASA